METLTCRGSKHVSMDKGREVHSDFFGSLKLEVIVYACHVEKIWNTNEVLTLAEMFGKFEVQREIWLF